MPVLIGYRVHPRRVGDFHPNLGACPRQLAGRGALTSTTTTVVFFWVVVALRAVSFVLPLVFSGELMHDQLRTV